MGAGVCMKCGRLKEPPEHGPPKPWCMCPPWDANPHIDEFADPSEDESYYEDYPDEYPED